MHKATCLETQGDFEGATEALGETEHTYEQLAQTYVRREMLDDGINAFTKTLETRRNMYGDGDPRTKELMTTIELLQREKIAKGLHEEGRAMKAQDDWDSVMQFFRKGMEIYKEIDVARPNTEAVYNGLLAV